MAVEDGFYDKSAEAAIDLSAKNMFIGIYTTGGKATLAGAAAGDFVIVGGSVAGEATAIRLLGRAKVKVNANSTNIAVGDGIIADANGFGVKQGAAGTKSIGKALEAATTDGAIITVELMGAYTV